MNYAIALLIAQAETAENNAPLLDMEGEHTRAQTCRNQAAEYRKAAASLDRACAPTETVANADARIFIGQPDSEAGNADPCNEALAAIEVMMLAQARQSASMALDCMRKNDIEGARFFAKDGVRLLEEAKKLVETKWNADVVLEDALESASKAFAEDDSGQTAPRITPADIEANIDNEYYFTAADGLRGSSDGRVGYGNGHPLSLLTFCTLVLNNGFTVTGESACASPENFDAEIGRTIARKNAIDKVWPLMGYMLKQRLHDESIAKQDLHGLTDAERDAVTDKGHDPMMIEVAAELSHEANRAYCKALGDDSQSCWGDAPDWQRASAIAGVEFHIANPDAGPSHSHDSWLRQKEADGWKYGPVKDAEKKEHPCFVPYDQLPPEQKAKDCIFGAIVKTIAGINKG